MTKSVSLREANQHFARLVREAEAGEDIVITRRGKPVVTLAAVAAPGERRELTREEAAALKELLEFARAGYTSGGWRFNREELYEERANRYRPRDDG